MKIRATIPLELAKYDIVSHDTITKLQGQQFPATDKNLKRLGTAVIVDVEWRATNDVLLTIEMAVDNNG